MKPRVIVILDGDEGVTIETCSRISRSLGHYIEEEALIETGYTLDVTSPGLDMPLTLVRQYRKNRGREVKVKRVEGDDVRGELLSVTDEAITIRIPGVKKQPAREEKIEFKHIVSTIVQVSFK